MTTFENKPSVNDMNNYTDYESVIIGRIEGVIRKTLLEMNAREYIMDNADLNKVAESIYLAWPDIVTPPLNALPKNAPDN